MRPKLAKLTKKSIKLVSKSPVGEGFFKAVYKGTLVGSINGVGSDGETVALIVLRRGAFLPPDIDVYERLARHPGLTRIMGVIETAGRIKHLILEWSDLGSLGHVMRGCMAEKATISPAVLAAASTQVYM